MIKQHKKMLILTSVITLLPIFIGLLLWRQLPASVATHFGVDNQPDGYCSKAFAVFGLPVMLLFFHLICIVATNIDPKRKNISKKVFHVVMWICPVISLVNCNILYVYNLGYKLNIGFVCGYSIGFRIPWALNDSDNWYHTHRFGGKCMVIGGIAMIVTSPFQNVWIFLALVIVPCILPVVYSYMFYRKTMG